MFEIVRFICLNRGYVIMSGSSVGRYGPKNLKYGTRNIGRYKNIVVLHRRYRPGHRFKYYQSEITGNRSSNRGKSIGIYKGGSRFAFYQIGRRYGNVFVGSFRNYHPTSRPLGEYGVPGIYPRTGRKLHARSFSQNAWERNFLPSQLSQWFHLFK